MSSTIFTKIENTIVSGSQLLSALTPDNVAELMYKAATSPALPLYLATLGTSISLTADGLVQAATSKLMIDTTSASNSTTYTIFLGPDTNAQARSYIRLFDLTTTSKKVLLNTVTTGATVTSGGGFTVTLSNDDATAVYVKILRNGNDGGGSTTQPIYEVSGGNLLAGTPRTIEVYSTNLTSGSETVTFNIGSGGG